MLLAFWLYLKDKFFWPAVAWTIDALQDDGEPWGASLTGCHWLFAGHRKPQRTLLTAYMVPIVLLRRFFLYRFHNLYKWVNPLTDFISIMSVSAT
jgi:hypothetical protein